MFVEHYILGRYIISDYRFFDTGVERGYFLVVEGEYDEYDLEVIKRNRIFAETYIYKDEGRFAIMLIDEKKEKFPTLNIIMFILTLISTLAVGALQLGYNPLSFDILKGWVFSVPLLSILGAHEFGHFIVARIYGIPTSWPYFIPFPSIIGTMGAVIRLRGFIPSRRALLHMAFAGPIAGFLVALPVLWIGLNLSKLEPNVFPSGIYFGEPLMFKIISSIIYGNIDDDMVLNIHPVGFAGWVGLFVTALNLIPMGQLDGGHILFALAPKYSRIVGWLVVFSLIIGGMFWAGWWVWAFFGIIMGVYHPPTAFSEKKLKMYDYFIGLISLLMFILCFIPIPIHIS